MLDDSVNQANWGIKTEYIAKHINRFVGRPFILTADRNHPPEFYGAIREDYNDLPGTINRYLHAQEKYRIGTIKKVEPFPDTGIGSAATAGSTTSSNSALRDSLAPSSSANHQRGWFAYIEITDPVAISAFKAGHIPKYVSPTVFRLNHEEKPDQTTDFEPLHLAAVDRPAYGFDKAGIRGSCYGDVVTCSNQLQQASPGIVPDCGFCIRGTLEGLTNRFTNSSFVNSRVKQGSDLTENNANSVPAAQAAPAPTDTQKQEQQQQPTQQQSQQAPIEPNTSGSGQPFTVTKAEPARQQQQQQQQQEEVKEKKEASTGAESKQDQDKDKEITKQSKKIEDVELRKAFDELRAEVKALNAYKQDQEKNASDRRNAELRAKIEKAIPENYADSAEERGKVVEKLMKYGDDLDYFLEKFVTPTVNASNPANKTRTQQLQKSTKLADYGSVKTSNVQQAAAPTTQFDLNKMRRIVAMSDIVGNSVRGGAL